MNAKVSFILGVLTGLGAGAGALYYQKKKFEKQLAEELSTQRKHLTKAVEERLGITNMEDPNTKPEPVEDNTTESSDDKKTESEED